MESENLTSTMGIAALVAAIAALVFAVVQTVAALSQHTQVSNRCSQRVTGVFDLKAGFWFHISSLSWNPQYRMPVITFARLRSVAPSMEPEEPVGFRHGLNFISEANAYKDYRVSRITAKDLPDKRLQVAPTALYGCLAVLWSPIGFIISSVSVSLCLLPALFCNKVQCFGCPLLGSDDNEPSEHSGFSEAFACLCFPLTAPWKRAVRYISPSRATRLSDAPGLESAAWCQLLVNTQATWWGYADIRWEWRLATMIPPDVYGATVETTMADLQLLALSSGMQLTADASNYIMAHTRCGELLTHSHHSMLGRLVYYRSGRENIGLNIVSRVSDQAPRFMACLLGLKAHISKRLGGQPSSNLSSSSNSPPPPNHGLLIATLFSRPRTGYDAQLYLPLGDLSFVLKSEGLLASSLTLHDNDARWRSEPVRTFLGPLGQGPRSCSCQVCCWQWLRQASQRILYIGSRKLSCQQSSGFWPALEVRDAIPGGKAEEGLSADAISPDTRIVGPLTSCAIEPMNQSLDEKYIGSKSRLLSQPVEVEVRRLCWGLCPKDGACACRGTIARIPQQSGPSTNVALAVAALNNRWLQKCEGTAVYEDAAQRLADLVVSRPNPHREETTPEKQASATAVDEGASKDAAGNRPSVEMVMSIMASTELALAQVREAIGCPNMWDGNPFWSTLFQDFGQVVLGA